LLSEFVYQCENARTQRCVPALAPGSTHGTQQATLRYQFDIETTRFGHQGDCDMANARSGTRRKPKNGSELNARVSALKDDFDSLQQNVRELLNSLGHEASSGLEGAAEAAVEAGGDVADKVETWSAAGAESVRGAIRTQPLAAIALSMGAGALLGSFLRR
jgi:ElaB/YqjD/DUF883 family membrane-anchored ribosome-binding protein